MPEQIYKLLVAHSQIIDVIGSIATTLTIMFLAAEYVFSRRTHRYNCEWQEKNKAAELALYYKDEIIPRMSYVNHSLNELKLNDLFGRIKKSEMRRFTEDELLSLVQVNISDEINKRFVESAKQMIIVYSNRHEDTRPLGAFLAAEEKMSKPDTTDSEKERARIDAKRAISMVHRKFHEEMDNLLNNLEYFSMNFTTGVADSSVVYPSLHQTYLETIEKLYWAIAAQNKNSKDKFFVHCIDLYKKWSAEDLQNAEAVDRACTSKDWRIKK